MSQVLFDNKNIEYGVRLLVACICGAIIGVERYKRSKGAGIRTHMLVALGAALFTIISKYGFEDVVCLENIQADAARVTFLPRTIWITWQAGPVGTKGKSFPVTALMKTFSYLRDRLE